MKISAYGQSDLGRRRQQNEDYFLIDSRKELFAVADGVGGQPAGEVASRLAIDKLLHYLHGDLPVIDDPIEKLSTVVRHVNDEIRSASAERPEWQGMATTLVAAWFQEKSLVISNVGDSRAYLFRANELTRLTEDHNLRNEQKRLGLELSEEKLAEMANVVTRVLGSEESEPDCRVIDIEVGDRLLLCSDGLTGMVDDDIIQTVIQSTTSPEEGCRMLIDLANRNGGRDNITVVLVYFDKPTLTQKLTDALTPRR